MAYTNYIDVYNEGRDTETPLITLYDDESIRLFFDLILAGGDTYKQYFRAGKIAMVSFNMHQSMQTGTGYYGIKEGKIEVLSETGTMKDTLPRIKYKKFTQRGGTQKKEGKASSHQEDDTAREQRYAEYLQQTLQRAHESGDHDQEAEVILQYHQAILEVAQAIEPTGEDAGKINLKAFRSQAAILDMHRVAYMNNPGTFTPAAMASFVQACVAALSDIQKLSEAAQAQIQLNIVTRFYDIRHPKK